MKTNEPAKDVAETVAKAPPRVRPVQRASAGAALPPLTLPALQSAAGNGAVVALLGVQRAANPTEHAPFNKVAGTVKRVAKTQKTHPPAKKTAAEAQKAAAPPANEKASKAAASQVATMAEQKPGEFDKQAFIAAVRKAIEAKSPKNLEEADEFSGSGKAGEVKAEVGGMVTGGKNAAAGAITSATSAPPDQGKVAVAEPVPMKKEVAGPAPPPVGGAAAMPARMPAAATDLSAGPAEVSGKMASAKVTDEQLAASNEPQFADAAQSKQALEAHAATAPAAARADEKAILGKSRAEAGAAGGKAVSAMRNKRGGSMSKANAKKDEAKAKEERQRAEFATKLDAAYKATKDEVTAILDGLDAKVGTLFDAGEAEARKGFEKQVADEMKAFRDERYDGIGGAAQWAWDKLTSPPPEVNQIFERARGGYLERMNGVIASVADLIGVELGKAKARIARGKADVAKLVEELPKNLKKEGAAAADKLQADFDSLSSDVESKQEGLVDDLATRYTTAAQAVDARVEQLKSENKGLLDKAKDAIVGAVQTILKLKDMLLGVLARAAGAIEAIISKPIEFLGNLIAAVKGGLDAFVANIGTHLQNGLLGWLTGALGGAGLTMPDKLDLRGIVSLVLQILGLTWANIRGRIAKAIGEPAMAAIQQGVEIVKTLVTEGPAGLWKWIVEKLSNLEDMVLGAIKDFVITRVITAGVTWLISLLNPAAAFIKACKAIYDIIMFFVERGSQIMEFVNSVLDSIGAIASGAIGGAVTYIEQTLAKAIPVAISFLASLLSIDGIAEKIREIIAKVRAPIFKVIDGIVGSVVKAGKKLWGKVKGALGGKKDKKDEKPGGSEALAGAMKEGQAALRAPGAKLETVRSKLAQIKTSHKVRKLELVVDAETDGGSKVHLVGANSPEQTGEPVELHAHASPVERAKQLAAENAPVVIEKTRTATVTAVEERGKDALVWCTYRKVHKGATKRAFPLAVFMASYTSGKGVVIPHDGGDHPSIFALADGEKFVLDPQYRPKWRSLFYGSKYSAANLARKLTALSTAFRKDLGPSSPGLCHEEDLQKPKRRWWFENDWTDDEMTFDHDPPVVQHWVDEGRLTGQAQRRSYYADGLWKLVPRRVNSSWGSENEAGEAVRIKNWEIGPEFRGPGDK